MRDYFELGAFEVRTPALRVTDPMYRKTTKYCATISPCLTGKWTSALCYQNDKLMGRRVALLAAKNDASLSNYALFNGIRIGGKYYRASKEWQMLENGIGVDSAQCGIFEESSYPDGGIDTYEFTLNEDMGDILPFGVISSSGHGDGLYRAFIHKDASGHVDAVAVSFL